MIIVYTLKELRETLQPLWNANKSIGFVPTMGYLHEGHASLMKAARVQNDIVVLSIFVNPTQFGPNEDLDRYPRDLERDTKIAAEQNVDIIFAPTVNEMYPEKMLSSIIPGQQATVLCGASRLGHFDGVLMVVSKLFNLVKPAKAYFGKKDAQQLAIIETFVRQYNVPVEIVRGETVRENDGLAKSSRNVFLTEQERSDAPTLQKALQAVKKLILSGVSKEDALLKGQELIRAKTTARIDYLELLEYPSLLPVTESSEELVVAGAIFFDKARLIDNVIFSVKGE